LTALAAFFAFVDDFALVPAAASSGISLAALAEPRPVQASQPGPAENAPLLPTVMSLKVEAGLAV